MRGIRVTERLDNIVRPLGWYLDDCWWDLGRSDVSLTPYARVRANIAPGSDEERRAFEADCERRATVVAEYTRWADGFLLGRPGFWSRLGGQLDARWQTLLACDAPDCPLELFRSLRPVTGDFTRPPPALPAEVCLLARNVDDVYWQLFFREDWMFWTVWSHVGPQKQFRGVTEI